MVSIKESRFTLGNRKKILPCEAGEALEQVVQGICGCHVPGIVQGQVGWSCDEPALVKGVPHRGIANRCSLSPFQPRPFYDFPSLCGLYLNYFEFSYLNMTKFCKLFHFDLHFETL